MKTKTIIKNLSLLFAMLIINVMFAQTSISGSVVDEQNNPLPGVNIVVQGSNFGTTADFDGNFSINVTQELPFSIEFSYLGFVTQVVQVLPIRDAVSSNDMFDVRYQIHLHDLYNLGFMGSLAEYVMSMQYLDMLDKVIDSDQKQINFDRHKNRIEIFMDWDEEVTVGEHIVVECYRVIDPDTFTDVYNDYYLKKYAAALVKKQWGLNLLKFEGMQMPGGVQFNGRQIYDDAVADLEKLEEEARLNWEQPVDFYTG